MKLLEGFEPHPYAGTHGGPHLTEVRPQQLDPRYLALDFFQYVASFNSSRSVKTYEEVFDP